MQCPRCQHENPAAAKFCLECGFAFCLKCTHCGTDLPARAKFCLECGQPVASPGETKTQPPEAKRRAAPPPHLAERILTSRSALEGERKRVTVLFADVVGFTSIAERLDPEDVHTLMDGCLRILAGEVHRYEGTVNQYTGDGIMALFGAPVAHENAPERAVRAALGMQAALRRYQEELSQTRGIQFHMRIGIHTGLVVVGKIGDDLHMDYTAIGDTTNLAARLQTAAAPGAVLVSGDTAKLVAGRFVMRSVGPLTLKGKSEPVPAHEVVRAVPRTPLVPISHHGLTPLVGRDTELAALERLFAHARAGRGQVAFVVGEAGIGKSRLIHEYKSRVGTEQVTWLEGRCVSFGAEMPFLPLVDLLKAGLGIEEGDGEGRLIDKIRRTSRDLGMEPAEIEPHLRSLLAVDPGDARVAALDGIAKRFAIFDALKRLMLASAQRLPLVVLIEDLHWIDEASDQFLGYIADALATAPVLLLCTHRPGYTPKLGERSYFTRLALQPLSKEETAAMTTAMLESEDLPHEIRGIIARKAEGNPFFIEEVTKSLLETGALCRTEAGYTLGRPVAEIRIPDTIQEVIMARIDRLGDAPKRAIQIASVIGREFVVRLLQRAADLGEAVENTVGELRALELIYEKSGVPELAYMFKHALTHDVAYESLLVRRRKELHRIIGNATESLYADRLGEHFETLAHHFYRGEDWPRACAYLAKAGDKARAAFANPEAILYYGRALEAAAHIEVGPKFRMAVGEGLGIAYFHLSQFPQAIDVFRRAVDLATQDEDRARLEAHLAEAIAWAHDFDGAVATAKAAEATGRAIGSEGAVALATHVIGLVNSCRGNLEEARQHYAESAARAETAASRKLVGDNRAFAGVTDNWQGDYSTGIRSCEQALEIHREINHPLGIVQDYSCLAICLGGAGHYSRALASIGAGITLGESIGDKVWRARLWNTRGWILGELGDFAAACEANRRCLELAEELGEQGLGPELIGNAEANLADAAIWSAEPRRAEPHLDGVARIVADPRSEWMVWRYGMHFHASAAELALVRGEVRRAVEHLKPCLATATRTQSRRYIVRATVLLAACHAADGDLAGAEELLARAVSDARALGNPPQLWRALLAHGRMLHALGQHDAARAAWYAALEIANAVAAALPDEARAPFRESGAYTTLAELGA
jgi:class 3 adenylate cyclase/tetratricopeptide (TPR) repeat protein